jgi:hypothetical protein
VIRTQQYAYNDQANYGNTQAYGQQQVVYGGQQQYGYGATGGGAQIIQGTSSAQGPSSMNSGSLTNKFAGLGISSMVKSPASGNVKSPILSPKV